MEGLNIWPTLTRQFFFASLGGLLRSPQREREQGLEAFPGKAGPAGWFSRLLFTGSLAWATRLNKW
jgi:hypothetical protein